MRVNQVSSSTKIYIDQISIYIQTGQGYQQIRVHLLTQLNQLDPQNPNSDQTLAPALMENLWRWLLTDSSELKSRTIDVLQDIIKHADQIVQSYINSQDFCITLHTAITYKLFNPFSKAIFDQNRLRLCSIVLFYHQKFQKDPSRYFHIFQLYKQLKQKNFTFPPKTFIEIPKVNQFKKQKPKTTSQNSSQSDKIGVTFDSIIQFVQNCEKQFKNNKASCANTQFVRALKVKAKTLFDLSQNTQGLQLSSKEKQHAKQLYKQIRTMLKEIEKISEEKIKQQKIKSEKQFAQQKIQQISPNKKKQSTMGSSQKNIEDQVKKQQKLQTFDLLNGISLKPVQVEQPPMKKVETPVKPKRETNLLDDDNLVQRNSENEFTEYTSQTKEINPVLSQSQKEVNFDGFKPIKKPPKPQAASSQLDQLIDIIDSSNAQQEPLPQQYQNLIQTVVQTGSFSKKSIKSVGKQSIRSQQSDKPVNLSDNQPNPLVFKQQDSNMLEFENAQHFSKFQVVNNYLDPNKYDQIPMDIDFSDSSSRQSSGSQRVTFDLLNKNNELFDGKNQPYDKTFRTPKKQTSYHETQNAQKDLEKLSLSANIIKQNEELLPNQNFGILADMREVKPYDYSQFQNTHLERSSMSNISEEERKIKLTPKSIKHNNEVTSLNDLSPTKTNFNSQKQKSAGNELLGQNDDGDNDEQFGNFQEVPTVFGMEGITFGSENKIGSQEKEEGKIMSQKSPEKGQLMEENEEGTLNGEPLL